MFEPLPRSPPPIPAPFSPPVAISSPSPIMRNLLLCKPAQLLPLFNLFTSARVITTKLLFTLLFLNAAILGKDETSIFTPARVIFAQLPSATSILSVVGVFGSVFFIVTGVSDMMVSTPSA